MVPRLLDLPPGPCTINGVRAGGGAPAAAEECGRTEKVRSPGCLVQANLDRIRAVSAFVPAAAGTLDALAAHLVEGSAMRRLLACLTLLLLFVPGPPRQVQFVGSAEP